MFVRRHGSRAIAALAVGALVAGGIALSAPAGAAKNVKPRAYQYGNWAQPGSGFTTGSDDTTSQVYQLTWRSSFADLDDTPGPIYAAGSFIKSGATTINRVGRWDDTTSSWVPLQGDDTGIAPTIGLGGVTDGAPAPGVYGMVLGGDDSLYVGGEFVASDTTLNNVGQWNGSDWVSMGFGFSAAVNVTPIQDMVMGNDFIGGDDVNYADDTIYALGGFNEICTDGSCTGSGTTADGIAQFSQATRTWSSAAASVTGTPFAGAYVDDTLYVGGTFTDVNSVSGTSKVAQRSASGTWRPLGAGLNSNVFSMAVHPITKDLYVGGTFTAAVGGAANSLVGVAKWDYEDDTWYAVGSGLTGPNVDDISFSADGKTMWIGNWGDPGPTVSNTVANGVARLTSEDFDDTVATTISGAWDYLRSAGVIGVTGPASPATPNQRSVRAALPLPNGSVMYGGNFSTAGPVTAGRVATFTPGPEPSPYDPVFPAGVPTDVVATSGWNKVTVDWKAPTYTGSYPITNYLVQASPGGNVCITRLTDPKLNQCTYTNLTPGVQYTFRVQALNGAGWGDRSAASNVASPQNLKITNYKRTKLNFFLGGGSKVTVSGSAAGFANGTRITPYLMWGNSGTWEEQRNSGLTAQGGRFSWERKFSKNNNGRTLSVKFMIAPNESNSVSMGPVR